MNGPPACLWRSPVGTTWEDWGVPSGAKVLTARLESAAGRVAACASCLSGQLNGYRLESSTGVPVATLWGGHPAILKTDVPVMEAWSEVRDGRKSARDGAAEATQKLNDLLKQVAA